MPRSTLPTNPRRPRGHRRRPAQSPLTGRPRQGWTSPKRPELRVSNRSTDPLNKRLLNHQNAGNAALNAHDLHVRAPLQPTLDLATRVNQCSLLHRAGRFSGVADFWSLVHPLVFAPTPRQCPPGRLRYKAGLQIRPHLGPQDGLFVSLAHP